ncbi:MAG: universal stress protein [Chitinophagaceae bacterium]|nr:MAG: universal stress protein [Chitinophagaceae bacterium]
MKKFIVAFDGLRLSDSSMSYAIDLAHKANAHLVGVFIEDPHLHSYSLAEIEHYTGESFEGNVRALNRKDDERRLASVETFRHACEAGGINFSIHRDRNAPLSELLHESIYADLLLIKANEGLRSKREDAPTSFVQQLISEARCPLLLVPEYYRHFNAIKLLYDGSPASVAALRAFSYLFEDLMPAQTEIITVKHNDENAHLPDAKLIKEFAKRHFPQADFTLLKGYADEAIVRHLRLQKTEPLLVLGAHRRGMLARLFRASLANQLLHLLKMPLFIVPGE